MQKALSNPLFFSLQPCAIYAVNALWDFAQQAKTGSSGWLY
jgi:hypothetical protein